MLIDMTTYKISLLGFGYLATKLEKLVILINDPSCILSLSQEKANFVERFSNTSKDIAYIVISNGFDIPV